METKETKTTVESILKDNDLKQFKKAEKVWGALPADFNKVTDKMAMIGGALNTLYLRGAYKGLKRDVITSMAREHFPGMNRRERSEYRKLADHAVEIKAFVQHEGVRSANPVYLVNSYLAAVKADCDACREIEKAMRGGLDVNGNDFVAERDVKGALVTSSPTKKVSNISETPKKEGFDNIVKPSELTPNEVVTQLGYIINQMKTMFNQGKLKAEHLSAIEKHLTTGIQHINSVDIEEGIQATG